MGSWGRPKDLYSYMNPETLPSKPEYMSYSQRGLYRGLYRGLLWGILRGDTRSLDYGSYVIGPPKPTPGLGAGSLRFRMCALSMFAENLMTV